MKNRYMKHLNHQAHATRGFTLLEVVIVAAISAIIFTLLIKWVLSLGGISSNTINTAAAARDATYTEERLAADLQLASPCYPGSNMIITNLTPTTLSFYINHKRPDPKTELNKNTDPETWPNQGISHITWQLSGNKLVRTETVIPEKTTTGCLPTGTPIATSTTAVGVNPGSDDRVWKAYDKTGTELTGTQANCETSQKNIAGIEQLDYDQVGACWPASISMNINIETTTVEKTPFKSYKLLPFKPAAGEIL